MGLGDLDRRSALKLIGAAGLLAIGAPEISAEPLIREAPGPIVQAKPASFSQSSRPWYGQELVRGHLSWLHPAWTRPETDFDPKTWIDQLQRAGFPSFVFYSKFHDGVCNWPSKLQDLKPERDFVGEITREAHSRGMKVIIYYSTGPDEWAADTHPDWRCVRRDGAVTGPVATGYKRWFKFSFCCPNSPYRQYALGQIAEILDNYNVDGFWLDVMEFPNIDPLRPELGHLGCFCPWCRAKYSKATGGGSLFDIDQTPAQREWEAQCYRELFEAAREIVQKKGPERSITYNGCGHPGDSSQARYWPNLQQLASYLSVEGFHFAQVQIGPQCRLCRSDGKPYEIICVASGQTIGWTPKSTDLILLEATTVAAHGGTYCCAMDPTAAGKLFESQINQLAEVTNYIHTRQAIFADTRPVYDAAVFHPSYVSHPSYEPDDTPLTRMSVGWPDLLDQRNIPYAYLYPNGDLSPFPLAVLDASFPLSEQRVTDVANYVQRGGNILVEFTPSQVEHPSAKRLLAEVLGVQVLGTNAYEAVYLDRLDPSIAQGLTDIPTLVEGPSFKIGLAGARPLAFYTYPIAPWSLSRMTFAFHNPPSDRTSADPAITIHTYGKGQAMFVACSLGGKEVRRHQNIMSDPETDLPQVHEFALQFGSNLVSRLIAEPIVRPELPAGVSIVINQQPQRYVVHLLNNLLDPVLFSDSRRGLIRLSGLTFALNETRTGRITQVTTADGRRVPIRRNGKWITVTVPELKVHEAVLFDRA